MDSNWVRGSDTASAGLCADLAPLCWDRARRRDPTMAALGLRRPASLGLTRRATPAPLQYGTGRRWMRLAGTCGALCPSSAPLCWDPAVRGGSAAEARGLRVRCSFAALQREPRWRGERLGRSTLEGSPSEGPTSGSSRSHGASLSWRWDLRLQASLIATATMK